jgi:hypothetical protein
MEFQMAHRRMPVPVLTAVASLVLATGCSAPGGPTVTTIPLRSTATGADLEQGREVTADLQALVTDPRSVLSEAGRRKYPDGFLSIPPGSRMTVFPESWVGVPGMTGSIIFVAVSPSGVGLTYLAEVVQEDGTWKIDHLSVDVAGSVGAA